MSALCVSTLCVSTLCITHHTFTSHHIKHHTFTCLHITHHKPKAERREHKEEVLGPSSWAGWHSHHITHHHISPDIRHHISPYHTSQAERREHKEEVLGPSSWAGWHSHHITHHHISPHQTSQAERAKKYEFYCENVVQEHPRRTKSTRITTKNEHRRS